MSVNPGSQDGPAGRRRAQAAAFDQIGGRYDEAFPHMLPGSLSVGRRLRFLVMGQEAPLGVRVVVIRKQALLVQQLELTQ